MRKVFYIAVLVYSQALFSQIVSNNGRFSVNFDKGCAPFTVEVTDLTNTAVNPQYIYDGADPTAPETLDTFFTYTAPASYLIIQINNSLDPTTDTVEIEVVESEIPDFDFFYCDESSVLIEILDDYYDSYELTTPDSIYLISEANEQLVLLPENQQSEITLKGFLDNTAPNCASNSIVISPIDIVPNVTLDDIEFQYQCNDRIRLLLNINADENTLYQLQYSNESITNVIYEGRIDTSALVFDSLQLENLESEICFEISALSPCDASVLLPGDSICEDLPDNFTEIEYAYATFNSEDIDIVFENTEEGLVTIEKSTENQIIQIWELISDPLTDISVFPWRQYEYNIIYNSDCADETQIISVRTPYVLEEEIQTNAFNLEYQPGVTFIEESPIVSMYIYNADDSTNNEIIEAPDFPYEYRMNLNLGANQIVQIIENYPNSNFTVLSNPLPLEYEQVVYVPSAFSPNGDGLNDVLEVFGLPSDIFEMHIYNKWGELIYVCSNTESFWNGRTKNRSSPEGVYIYKIFYEGRDGEQLTQSGSFLLMKN